jgi:hypothetical protein
VKLLTQDEWAVLLRLYVVGKIGIPADESGYRAAGPWSAVRMLRDQDPPLVREVFRLHDDTGHRCRVVITEAGVRFYETKQRQYNVLYPPGGDSA